MAAMPRDAWRIRGYKYQVGSIYELAGQNDEALSVLGNISYGNGYTNLSLMDTDPFLDNLRDDPRLQEIRANRMAQLEAARLAAP